MTERKAHGSTVEADAAEIVERLETTNLTLSALMREYRCGNRRLMAAILSVISKRKWRTIARRKNAQGGVATRFRKGLVPWNTGIKGLRMSPETEFKAGCLRGNAARHWRPIGAINVRYDKPPRRYRARSNARPGPAHRWIKIADDGPPQRRWIPYARYLWQQAHGPVPAGCLIVHADGDTLNDAPENLILVTRRRHMQRLHAHRPEAIALARRRSAAVTRARHAANRQRRRERPKQITVFDCAGCGARFARRPEQCPKCNAAAFESLEVPA